MRKILILGGTRDARETADLLVDNGFEVTTSLAGITQRPLLPKGQVRIGGFGGVEGLRKVLVAGRFDAVVDATHPFAVRISSNLTNALHGLNIEHLRIAREPWVSGPGDTWTKVSSAAEAANSLPRGAHVFLTIGRKDVGCFVSRADLSGLIRCVERPTTSLSDRWVLMRGMAGTSVEAEMKLMRENRVTHVVSKNSGGLSAWAKIEASARLSLPVLMIGPPTKTGGSICNSALDVLTKLQD
jgi:precorrin-6A/cobalt-precorrin-6A reductase